MYLYIYIYIISYLVLFYNSQHGQQCCYYKNGTLAVGPKAGGTVDLYSPVKDLWRHVIHDVIPFIDCCTGILADCSAYYARRPSDNGNGYRCRRPGMYCLCFALQMNL